MVKLVNLKHTPKEIKDHEEDQGADLMPPEYPWGLTLRLEGEVVAKLGKEFKAGEEVLLVAHATVKSVNNRSEESEEGVEAETRVELQITDMAVQENDSDKERANKLFPSMSENKKELQNGTGST